MFTNQSVSAAGRVGDSPLPDWPFRQDVCPFQTTCWLWPSGRVDGGCCVAQSGSETDDKNGLCVRTPTLLQGVSERMIFFLIGSDDLVYVRMYMNNTKSESPHYDI